MEMCYDGALVMPSSYAVMDSEEMTYVEGGFGYYISNGKLQDIMYVFMVAYSTAPKIMAAGTYKVCCAISKAISSFTSKIGKICGGVVGSFVGWAVGAYCGWELAKAVVTAMVEHKGIKIGWGFSVE